MMTFETACTCGRGMQLDAWKHEVGCNAYLPIADTVPSSEHRLKLAASAIVAEWRKNGTADRDELRRNLVAALAEVETPADKFRLLAQKFAEPMVHGGYTRTDTLTFTVDGLERFVAAVFAEEVR